MILEPVAWWQAYAEWYARPLPWAEEARRLAASLEQLRAAFMAAMPGWAEVVERMRVALAPLWTPDSER